MKFTVALSCLLVALAPAANGAFVVNNHAVYTGNTGAVSPSQSKSKASSSSSYAAAASTASRTRTNRHMIPDPSHLDSTLNTVDTLQNSLSHDWDSTLNLAAEAAKNAAVATKKPDDVSIKTASGAAILMASIVGLLALWDKAIELFRRQVPVSLKPTVESIFSTLSGLGVIGVLIGSVLGIPAVAKNLESLSKEYFGKKDILVTNFEFFHEAYLQLGVVFFVCIVAMILKGLQKLNDIDEIQDAIVDQQTGYRVTANKLVGYYTQREFNRPQEQPGYTGILRELFMERSEWSAKMLMLRNLVMDLVPSLPPDFRVEALIEESFAQNMYRAVQIPYLAWGFIIPALAFTNAIDLQMGVTNSGSTNAAATAGEFIDAFVIFTPAISAVIISSIWSYWNCWKMTQIKYMILPKLEPDPVNGGEPVIRAPPIYSDYLRQTFDSSPSSLQRVEAIWGKPPRTAYDELFGEAGAAGLELYLNSIKYQAMLCIVTVTYFGIHVLPRDAEVLTKMTAGVKAGEPTLVSIELFTYGIFFLIALFQLTLVTPRTFWNYCIIAAMEDENLQYLLDVAGYGPGYVGGSTLGRLSNRQGLLPASGSGQGRAPIRGVTTPYDTYGVRDRRGGGGGFSLNEQSPGGLRLEESRQNRYVDDRY